MRSRASTPSESTTVRPSKFTLAGRAGRVPAAMIAVSKRTRHSRVALVTATVCGSSNRAVPVRSAMWLLRQLVADDVHLPGDYLARLGAQVLGR
jgi:hypothetical protein